MSSCFTVIVEVVVKLLGTLTFNVEVAAVTITVVVLLNLIPFSGIVELNFVPLIVISPPVVSLIEEN